MDFDNISAEDFGRSLTGLGMNMLVRNVPEMASFLTDVFGMQAHRQSEDYAIMIYAGQTFQLHADHTYSSNPLTALLPESSPRGAGLEIRLYDTDPDEAAAQATTHAHDSVVLEAPVNKPHGLRECIILCENGYAWLPSRKLSDEEVLAASK